MKTVSVVIPTWNHYNLLHSRLYELYSHQGTVPISEVIVVDDASDEKSYEMGIEWWKGNGLFSNLRHLRLTPNRGFIRSSNVGIQNATGDVVILLSSDVRILTDVIDPIMSILKADERTLVGGRLIDWDSGWNTFNGRIYPYIEGWLLAMTKDGWEELDYLDEDLMPHDFEDVSLSTKALQFGYKLIPLNNSGVEHIGAQTIGYNPEREAITNRNREIFKRKYVK